jgi:predicted transcriptional regulator
MLKKSLPQPSPGELELLAVLWELGPSTVKQVHTRVSRDRAAEKTLTTTLKLIQVMEQKGLVKREGTERPYLFHAALSEEEAQRRMVKDITARGFQGNAKNLVLCALETSEISLEELKEIRALLNARKGKGANT